MSDQSNVIDDETNGEDVWDFARAEVHEPPRAQRAVVSVAFPRDDFERVANAARASQMKVSEFIRKASLERADQALGRTRSFTMSSSGAGVVHGSFTAAAAVRYGEVEVVIP